MHGEQRPVLGVCYECVGAASQDGGGAGHIKQEPRLHNASAEGIGSRVTRASGNDRARCQAKIPGCFLRGLTNCFPGFDNAWKFLDIHPKLIA